MFRKKYADLGKLLSFVVDSICVASSYASIILNIMTCQNHMITYLHPHVRMSPDVLYQTIISTFRTPIDTPSDLSEFDIERLEPRL